MNEQNEHEVIISSSFRLKDTGFKFSIEFDEKSPQDAKLKIHSQCEDGVKVSDVRRLIQAFQDKYPFAFEEKQD
jgi:hypothetical protein